MKALTCYNDIIIDKVYNDVYHVYVINDDGNFIPFVKSERENRVITIPLKCWGTIDKMRQKIMEDTA